jgi:pyruvate dehydrogenase E2 component (dihydrolipoamide acetyltransferase)
VDWFTPIINQPESAILGVGRIVDDVLPIDGAAAVRPAMGLSLSFDHRVVDGAPAAEFLRTLIDLIDDPMSLVP